MNVYQFDEAPRSVKDEGAQTLNSELSLPKTAFPQRQAEDEEERKEEKKSICNLLPEKPKGETGAPCCTQRRWGFMTRCRGRTRWVGHVGCTLPFPTSPPNQAMAANIAGKGKSSRTDNVPRGWGQQGQESDLSIQRKIWPIASTGSPAR